MYDERKEESRGILKETGVSLISMRGIVMVGCVHHCDNSLYMLCLVFFSDDID